MINFKKSLKNIYYKISGKYRHVKKGIDLKYTWYGNEYGGFYVNNDKINEESVVYSFGIGEDVSFDKEIIEKFGSQVFGFDPTPKSIAWVENQKLPSNFRFYSYGISKKSGLQSFHLPKNKTHVSGSLVGHGNVSIVDQVSVEMKSFEDIIAQLDHGHIDVVKMDIEGSEYDVLDSILNSGILINQFLIEFHERFFEDGKEKTIKAINSLNEKGYEIFAISDSYEEVSFIRIGIL